MAPNTPRFWVGGVVAAIALVDIGALDGAAGELLGGIDDAAERMSIIGVAGQCLGVEHELATHWKGLPKYVSTHMARR